jgi:ABC-2 type transport system permease protein
VTSDLDSVSTRTLVRRLAAKDLYLNRGMMLVALFSGIASLFIAGINRTGYSIGSVSFITTVIAYGVILAMYNVAQERKVRSFLFVLSLPLAPRDYVHAKLLGTLVTFLIPWTVLAVGAFVLIKVTWIPDGLLPITVLLLVYFVCTFSIVTAAALLTTSEAVTTLIIVATNMSVTFFMFAVGPVTHLNSAAPAATPDWNATVLAILAGELVLIAAALVTPSIYFSRKRDFF